VQDFKVWNWWNQGPNWRKLKVWWSIGDPIEPIENQGPNCKRYSILGLAIEFDMEKIAWNAMFRR
jgi:hypothetical protein